MTQLPLTDSRKGQPGGARLIVREEVEHGYARLAVLLEASSCARRLHGERRRREAGGGWVGRAGVGDKRGGQR